MNHRPDIREFEFDWNGTTKTVKEWCEHRITACTAKLTSHENTREDDLVLKGRIAEARYLLAQLKPSPQQPS